MNNRVLDLGTQLVLLKTQSAFLPIPESIESMLPSVGKGQFPISPAEYLPPLDKILEY